MIYKQNFLYKKGFSLFFQWAVTKWGPRRWPPSHPHTLSTGIFCIIDKLLSRSRHRCRCRDKI